VRLVFDNNYFNDCYQGIPIGGYNKLIEGLLDGIDTMTGIDFIEERKKTNSQFSILNSHL
jgi:UDP-galactopyranose mutase